MGFGETEAIMEDPELTTVTESVPLNGSPVLSEPVTVNAFLPGVRSGSSTPR